MVAVIRLVGPPDEVGRAGDVDALLRRVLEAMACSPLETVDVLRYLERHPCTIEVRSGADIAAAIVQAGLACPNGARGVTLSASRIWVLRLDWPGLLAHELSHVVRRILGGPEDEREARRVADAFA